MARLHECFSHDDINLIISTALFFINEHFNTKLDAELLIVYCSGALKHPGFQVTAGKCVCAASVVVILAGSLFSIDLIESL